MKAINPTVKLEYKCNYMHYEYSNTRTSINFNNGCSSILTQLWVK